MINTTKGEKYWERIKHKFEYIESNMCECLQPVLQCSQPESSERVLFWNDYKKFGFEKVIRKRYHITDGMLLKNHLYQVVNIIRQK